MEKEILKGEVPYSDVRMPDSSEKIDQGSGSVSSPTDISLTQVR